MIARVKREVCSKITFFLRKVGCITFFSQVCLVFFVIEQFGGNSARIIFLTSEFLVLHNITKLHGGGIRDFTNIVIAFEIKSM